MARQIRESLASERTSLRREANISLKSGIFMPYVSTHCFRPSEKPLECQPNSKSSYRSNSEMSHPSMHLAGHYPTQPRLHLSYIPSIFAAINISVNPSPCCKLSISPNRRLRVHGRRCLAVHVLVRIERFHHKVIAGDVRLNLCVSRDDEQQKITVMKVPAFVR